MASRTPSARRTLLGRWLRAAREAAGHTTRTAAELAETNEARISRVENGLVVAKAAEVSKLLDIYQVTEKSARSKIDRLTQTLDREDWFDRHGSILSERGYRDWLSLEQHAAWAHSYEALVIPGLLQTEEYARTIFSVGRPGIPEDHLDQLVSARLSRQRILTKDNDFKLWVIIDEAALRRPVGNRFTHRAQLIKLIDIAEGAIPSVSMQILSFSSGAHLGTEGAFTIFGFEPEAAADLVCIEGRRAGLVLSSSEDIKEYNFLFEQLAMQAQGPMPSRDIIYSVIQEL